MSVLLALIPLALLLGLGAVFAFIWAVRSGQLDDLDTPALRVLLDDERPRPHSSAQANANTHQETHHR
jgi:cbb3-type cytochrome oxidase maturation protein